MVSVPAPGTQPSALTAESLSADHTASRSEQREPVSNSSAVVVTLIVAPDAAAGIARQPTTALSATLGRPCLPRSALMMYRMLISPSPPYPAYFPGAVPLVVGPSNPAARRKLRFR